VLVDDDGATAMRTAPARVARLSKTEPRQRGCQLWGLAPFEAWSDGFQPRTRGRNHVLLLSVELATLEIVCSQLARSRPGPHSVLDGSAPARLTPERYGVQFTASQEYVELVSRARALLSHAAPRLTLDELHLHALRSLVADLQREKYAVTDRPRKRSLISTPRATPLASNALEPHEAPKAERTPDVIGAISVDDVAEDPRDSPRASAGGPRGGSSEPGDHQGPDSELESPRQRGRYVRAAVRRAVFGRDQGRCTYIDASGRRCAETHRLELHHVIALLSVASRAKRTSRFAVRRTTRSPLKRISGKSSLKSRGTRPIAILGRSSFRRVVPGERK
jgi:hypothetical protein